MFQSQRFEEHSGMEVGNQEEFAAVLNALLPEVHFGLCKQIERQLMKDIEQQLQAEFQQKYQKAIEDINNQALQQYEQAIMQLEESRQILQKQKQSEIQKEIQSLESLLAQLQQQILIKLQQKFLEENFDSKVMNHPRIQELQKEIEEQIYEALEEKHEATKQRQLKELIIAHETKEIKLRKQLDQQIKSRIYCSSGLQELKQQIKQSKTQMGSQKSEYNLRLKKIQTEIKEYQEKIKQYEKMPNLQDLREKYQELNVDLIEKQTQKELQNDQRKRQLNTQQDEGKQYPRQINDDQDSLDQNEKEQNYQNNFPNYQEKQLFHQQSHTKTLKRQQRNQLLNQEGQFHNNQKSYIDEEYSQSESGSQIPSQQNSRKFDLTAYFKDYLLSSQTAKITQSQDVVRQQNPLQKKSLLHLENVSDLLKQKITMDPLERYLNKQSVSKENDMNAHNINYPTNQKASNFAELYEQHLKNLNKGFVKKNETNALRSGTQGLSQMAKKTIIKNIATYHRENFSNTTEENKRNQKNINNFGHESYKSHESNLLASYK